MIERLLQKNVQQFIEQHAHDDEQLLLLKHTTIFDLPASEVVWQISGRRKAKIKLPLFYQTANIVYPPGLNLEQSSSEETAVYKASLLAAHLPTRNSLVDLTGGFGVDSFFFSRKFDTVTCIEPNAALLEYATHNHHTLGAENIFPLQSRAEDFLNKLQHNVSCFFIDPSRRTTSNQKVFKLADCEPNVVALLPKIFEHSDYLLVKAAPLLDLHRGLLELGMVKNVWIVSVKNEVKELHFLCEKNCATEPVITAINLQSDHETFSFQFSEEKKAAVKFSDPLTYLYEPNASVLKAGAFRLIADRFSLEKLHPNTHLYTSNKPLAHFPGRVFSIEALLKADAKDVARQFPEGKANVVTRNYPLSPDALKKKLKLQDGGEKYLIGCSGERQKFLIAATRIT